MFRCLYSSVVERQSCKLKVLGSIPSGGYLLGKIASTANEHTVCSGTIAKQLRFTCQTSAWGKLAGCAPREARTPDLEVNGLSLQPTEQWKQLHHLAICIMYNHKQSRQNFCIALLSRSPAEHGATPCLLHCHMCTVQSRNARIRILIRCRDSRGVGSSAFADWRLKPTP